jgi:hypothetical protein
VRRACSTQGEKGNEHRVFLGKPGGKRPLGSFRRKWQDNIKMYLREIGLGGMYWIDLLRIRTGAGLL